jgi:hypothetical protein
MKVALWKHFKSFAALMDIDIKFYCFILIIDDIKNPDSFAILNSH